MNENYAESLAQLTARVVALEERLAQIEIVAEESWIDEPTQDGTTAGPSPSARPSIVSIRKELDNDPFRGLFSYYFVLGTVLLAVLGIVLGVTEPENRPLAWWIGAGILTLYQSVFLGLGFAKGSRVTQINAGLGLLLAILVDIGIKQFVPFPF